MLLILPYKTAKLSAIYNMLIFKIDRHLSPSRVCNIHKEKKQDTRFLSCPAKKHLRARILIICFSAALLKSSDSYEYPRNQQSQFHLDVRNKSICCIY